jgi:minor extracellular serine protease Vpr
MTMTIRRSKHPTVKRWGVPIVTVVAVSLATTSLAAAEPTEPDRAANRDLPSTVLDLKLDAPIVADGVTAEVLDQSLVGRVGPVRLIVHLNEPSVAESGAVTDAAQVRQVGRVKGQQQAFEQRLGRLAPGATTIGSVQRVLNAVFVEADAESLASIASDPAVERVAPVGDYELDLSETVPYIGASAVQATGVDGSGVEVAVLDSGIDYTHANLGGPGTLEAYEAAYGTSPSDPRNTTLDGLFPTAKVVGGYDFVGESWPNGPEVPDPDPIDFEGHGTHVADIIAGVGGVAPGASLYAVKVCSAVSSSCSGIALIQGMEFSADPNGDGRTRDRVDIINMSLGSNYGQPFDDDLSLAVEGATALGILTVASAGNASDKPYIVGTPSATPSALSVAQTQVPSAGLQLLTMESLPAPVPAVFQPWSTPPAGVISGPLQYGNGAGGNLLGCDAFPPGSLDGKVVLVDRGGCNFTLKVKNVGVAGGIVGIIGLVSPDAPFSGGDGGDRPIDIPGYMVSQADNLALRARVGQILTVDPGNQLPLVGQMVGSSSRGPSNSYQQIKPEIGAPGASVSAIAGSGTGTGPFGGTSGAAPMVSGAAALLLDGFSTNQRSNGGGNAKGLVLRPGETKALLMNNAETDIDIDPFLGLAEITRIGGGEVRPDRAIAAPTAAWDNGAPQAALSFGMHEVSQTVTLTKTVRIRNFSNEPHTYAITPTFRFAGDATGAVTPSAPATVVVKPGLGQDATFDISLTIDPALLPGNFMNSGSNGASGAALSANEFDGYLVLDNGKGHVINLPWHVLPRKAAETVAESDTFPAGSSPATVGLTNTGAGTAQLDAYALLAESPEIPSGPMGSQSPVPDIKSVGINTYPVPAGFCSGSPSFLWAFAVDTWEDQSHLLPVSHQIYLDTDQNGIDDYVVLNRDLSGLGTITDGRQLAWVLNLATGSASAFFFAEHATNTGNTVLLVCGEQIGMNATDLGVNQVDMDVVAQDFYFGGPGDSVEGLTVTPLGERFYGVAADIPGGSTGSIDIYDFGALPGNSPEVGVMVSTNGDRGAGARGGSTDATDTVIIRVVEP